MTQHIVMFSGGLGSWYAARRVRDRLGPQALLTLAFADTKMEDEDLYRFLDEAATNVAGQLVVLADGRDPWQVFADVRFLGNSRVDPCSRILKRELLRRWLDQHFDPAQTVVYLGIDWSEAHRFEKAQRFWAPWQVQAPLCEPPFVSPTEIRQALAESGIKLPRLYDMGFAHNNCGGFCVKAGQQHFATLLQQMPARYRYHEGKEEEIRQLLQKDVSILKDRRGGITKPLTMRAFRERLEAGQQYDTQEWGGCGCFSGSVEEGADE